MSARQGLAVASGKVTMLPESSVRRVVEDFADADLGDPRRTRRAQQVVAAIARSPSVSLPVALSDDAELEGAYRLMNNQNVNPSELLASVTRATKKRAEEAGDVLVLHDTTDCSFPHLDGNEIGFLPTGKAGFRLHLGLVVAASGWRRPLGVISAETIHRSKRSKHARKRKVSGVETATWEDREFHRWCRGMKVAGDALAGCDRVIHIADREGDSYDLMAALLDAGQRFIIRVRVDRRGRAPEDTEWSTVKGIAQQCDGILEREVPLSRRKKKSAPGMNRAHRPRKKRLARLRFAATRVVIPRPKYLKDPVPPTLELNLIHVTEIAGPDGEPPVEWLLYTTEPIDSPEQVAQRVDDYRTRWTIEEFNSALKTGCAYEARQFESRRALLTMLALSLPIACEVLALRSLARSSPDAPATAVLTPTQVNVLRATAKRPLPANPTVGQALLAVAAMGGHQRNNGAPGWRVLQRGMARLLDYEAGWIARETEM